MWLEVIDRAPTDSPSLSWKQNQIADVSWIYCLKATSINRFKPGMTIVYDLFTHLNPISLSNRSMIVKSYTHKYIEDSPFSFIWHDWPSKKKQKKQLQVLPKATCFVFFRTDLLSWTSLLAPFPLWPSLFSSPCPRKHLEHGFSFGDNTPPATVQTAGFPGFLQNWSSKKIQSFVQIFLSIIVLHDFVNFCIVQAVSNTVRVSYNGSIGYCLRYCILLLTGTI